MTTLTPLDELEAYLKKNDTALDDNTKQFELLKGLAFYDWYKSKDQQYDTFVGTIGLPKDKHDVEHPLYEYEQRIFDYIQRDEPTDPKNKHLYILKSAGLGATTFLLYYIGWRCTVNDDWSNGRVCILTAPRIELTIDIIDRLKRIFTNWNDSITFDSRNTICQINRTKIEAFPSHLGLKGMRGLTDVKMIVCDEASFFDDSNVPEVRDIIERYWAKTNPIIVLCSTPNKPNDLMDLIRKEPEESTIYHRLYYDYTVGLNKIYTQQEIELQRYSPSFPREYDLRFTGGQGNVFHTEDIEEAIRKGLERGADFSLYSRKSLGIDPSPGKAGAGLCITEAVDGIVNVIYSEEIERPDFNDTIDRAIELILEYNMRFDNGCRIFIDGANPSFIRELCKRLNKDPEYEDQINRWKSYNGASIVTLDWLIQNMYILPVQFAKYTKQMLFDTKKFLEYQNGQIAIHPDNKELIISLQTATENGEGALDKKATSYSNVFDALRLSLLFWRD